MKSENSIQYLSPKRLIKSTNHKSVPLGDKMAHIGWLYKNKIIIRQKKKKRRLGVKETCHSENVLAKKRYTLMYLSYHAS